MGSSLSFSLCVVSFWWNRQSLFSFNQGHVDQIKMTTSFGNTMHKNIFMIFSSPKLLMIASSLVLLYYEERPLINTTSHASTNNMGAP